MPAIRPNDARSIWCPGCGKELSIPKATQSGRKIRCGICETAFRVPDAPPRIFEPRTRVSQYDVSDLPADLQRELEKGPPIPEPRRAPRPPRTPRPRLKQDIDVKVTAQKAFDLDKRNRIQARTGCGMIDTGEFFFDEKAAGLD